MCITDIKTEQSVFIENAKRTHQAVYKRILSHLRHDKVAARHEVNLGFRKLRDISPQSFFQSARSFPKISIKVK